MSESVPYRVLARKYRPQNFNELIGQDALVRTLKNAIESGRIAHAFMLTGVRGVGKTTTARIIAKALNYIGPDGKGGPTTGPTDDCLLCRAISEDRHPDVIEMDAASRTGVDDIREIIDGVRYAPTEARYKIYIIDEVHMLSKNAFNALLKTLEEPPPHVKFIFATTEIRKVPVTVLSRCQRFDLRRVEAATLAAHYKDICAKENAQAEDEAIAMIARAADGSVRDGLSLLDQAISLGAGNVATEQVKNMLGLADGARVLDLYESALAGKMPEAMEVMDGLYRDGADPLVLMQDFLDITHMLTRLRAVPESRDLKRVMSAEEMGRLGALAKNLSMPVLGRAWQILLKGLSEVQAAPNPQSAAEMIVIRLAYAADLPDPADLARKLKDQPPGNFNAPAPASPPPARETVMASSGNLAYQPQERIIETRALRTLEDIVAALNDAREVLLASQVYQYAHLVKIEEGRLEIWPQPEAPPRLAPDLGQALTRLAGTRWIVTVSGAPGAPTLAQRDAALKDAVFSEVLNMPAVRGVFEVFPDAKLVEIMDNGKR